MSIMSEFKAFVARGNVVDLAVGFVVGGAFTKIVTSFTTDLMMPPIGLVLGRVDFSSLFVNLSAAHYETLAEARKAGAATINYGIFINTVVDFLIIAFAVFLLVKWVNHLTGPEPEAVTMTMKCPFCRNAIAIDASRCGFCTSQIEAA